MCPFSWTNWLHWTSSKWHFLHPLGGFLQTHIPTSHPQQLIAAKKDARWILKKCVVGNRLTRWLFDCMLNAFVTRWKCVLIGLVRLPSGYDFLDCMFFKMSINDLVIGHESTSKLHSQNVITEHWRNMVSFLHITWNEDSTNNFGVYQKLPIVKCLQKKTFDSHFLNLSDSHLSSPLL